VAATVQRIEDRVKAQYPVIRRLYIEVSPPGGDL
jgi:hypothetical protein